MGLRIFDTQRREKVDFTPLEAGKVRMYVCGITSYAPTHIGHARVYIAFDTVYRWLKRRWEVTYVRNYTDVDDKIIHAANANHEDPKALSARYVAAFAKDMAKLGVSVPQVEPKVTEHIPEIVKMIETLVAKGHAYPLEGDVYFDVMRFPAYGRLSGRTLADLEDLEAGARVGVDARKKSPYDFALWKAAKPNEPSWPSPWGPGRPGWHIECSAMSARYLGMPFDIHGGGKDLVFPHHENEVAQSCAASGQPFLASVWMHNGFVNLLPEKCPKCGEEIASASGPVTGCAKCGYVFSEEELKMSKSRGNFYPVGEVIAAYEPEALRFLFLGSHYRTPIQFSHTSLKDAEKRLERLYETLSAMGAFVQENTFIPGQRFEELFGFDPAKRFEEAMDDDFNTARAIAEVLELFKIANDLLHGVEKERLGRVLGPADKARILSEIHELIAGSGAVLGLWQEAPAAFLERRRAGAMSALSISPAEIARLIEERNEARRTKNWKRSDEIRDFLKARSIVLKDNKDGTTTWEAATS